MIIQCEQCSTRFRLDDAKVTDKGVKVRCAKCRHVFTVTKEQPETEPQPDFGALLDQSAAFDQEEAAASAVSGPDITENGAEFSFDMPQNDSSLPPAGDGEWLAGSCDKTALAAGTGDSAAFDFGDDNLFGEKDVTPAFEGGAGEATGDFMQAEQASETQEAETAAEEPFSFGGIDFDDDSSRAAEGQTATDKPTSWEDTSFTAPAEARKDDEQHTGGEAPAEVPVTATAQEELPPLSITSRRKHSPVFTGLIAILAAVAVALLGYFGYSEFLADKQPKVNERITLRAVNASFVKNAAAGDLLVIRGEAVNEYLKPRAAIQVKAMAYGANGQVLASRNAFAGNPLSKEQLAAMPPDRIEAAMANQFGDSLANLEVPPGKAIPFVVVIAKVPAEAKEYGVESAGSTVATGKQP
jgi:predicted Zn finger-like uncharacterized protein